MKKTIMCFVVLLAIVAAATGPARAKSNPTKYTSGQTVALSELQVGDTLCEGATINATSGYKLALAANRHRESSGVVNYEQEVESFPLTLGTGASMLNFLRPATESGQDGDAWVVSAMGIKYEQQYVYCAGILLPAPPKYTLTFADGTEDAGNWTIIPDTAATTGVLEGAVVTVKYNGTSRINSIELKSKMLTTPLTLEAITAGNVKVQSPKNGMKYKKNNEDTVVLGTSTTTINVAAGDKVAFYGDGTTITTYQGTYITGGTAEVKVYGNIMSLVNEEHFDTATTLTAIRAFYSLFRANDKLSDASGLLLPATTLTERCYMGMFERCTSLTTAPAKLPATTLTGNCYAYMFQGCTSLTTAPELPAPVLAPMCYYEMFSDCRNLNSVTCLAIDISASSCTRNWLNGAGSLVTGTKTFNAASPANWLMNDVSGIPSGWTLVTPAHTPLTMEALTDGTIEVNIIGSSTLSTGMKYAVNGGEKTTITTTTTITVAAGDKVQFYGNGTSTTSYGDNPVVNLRGTAETKVYGNIMSLLDETGYETATAISGNYVFYALFRFNAYLKDASGLLLPATTLANDCYSNMFHDCYSLTEAPVLPAPTLVSGCYNAMFTNCRKLNSVTCLATSGINQSNSTDYWLEGAGTEVEGTKTVFTNPNAAANAWPTSNNGIPEGWTRQNIGAQSTPEPVTLVPTGNANEWTFTMPADNMLLKVSYYDEYTLDSIPLDWQVKIGDAEPVYPTAYTEGNTSLGHLTITETDSVELIPPADVKPNVKNVTLVEPLQSLQVGGDVTGTIYYLQGETWRQAIQNHPTENNTSDEMNGWSVWGDPNKVWKGETQLYSGGNPVDPDTAISSSLQYQLQW